MYELERFVFVPPASCTLWPDSDLSIITPILFDRYEFTRSDLRHYWPERETRSQSLSWKTDVIHERPERSAWPAAVDFDEAMDLASLRGMRIPTPIEWLHVAVGRRNFETPWGGSREYFANTVVVQEGQDFSLKSPCNVGTYENGKSRPFGCYDLLGNVWEWVDGVIMGCEPPPIVDRAYDELDDGNGAMKSIMGGAYDTLWRRTFELEKDFSRQRFHARRVHRRTLSPSIGVRMCADAGPYLLAKAPEWGTGERTRARVRAVARRWAQDDAARSALRGLLADLQERPGAPEALAWLAEGLRAAR